MVGATLVFEGVGVSVYQQGEWRKTCLTSKILSPGASTTVQKPVRSLAQRLHLPRFVRQVGPQVFQLD